MATPAADLFVKVENPGWNDGRGRFSSVEAGALNQPLPCFGMNSGGVSDYDNDGWLDLFLTGAWSDQDATRHLLLHGRGDGAFERATDNSFAPEFWLDCSWVDIDNDGDQDLIVAMGSGIRAGAGTVPAMSTHGSANSIT